VPPPSSNYPVSDVVVVGGGHNALVCAAYLAEAGLSVTVLEGRDVIGGNTMTEELTLPGWRHDSCSTAHVVLQSNPLIRDDELALIARYGLEYIVTDPAVVFPLVDGDLLTVHPDLTDTAAEFARYSRADADALVTMIEDWNAGQRIAHAHVSAGLALPDKPWSHSYEQLRRRSASDVIVSTFHHPVVRPGDDLDGLRHYPATGETWHRRAAGGDHGRSAGLRLGHAGRRVGRVAESPCGPYH
jgi:phytoene dehydrogenase-like protein